MPWNDGPNSGFARPDIEELWLPICREHATVNVQTQLADPASLLNLYRQLLALRHASPALTAGSWRPHRDGGEGCLAYIREAGAERRLVALNLTGEPRRLALHEPGVVALATGLDRAAEPVETAVALRPNEGVIVDVSKSGSGE